MSNEAHDLRAHACDCAQSQIHVGIRCSAVPPDVKLQEPASAEQSSNRTKSNNIKPTRRSSRTLRVESLAPSHEDSYTRNTRPQTSTKPNHCNCPHTSREGEGGGGAAGGRECLVLGAVQTPKPNPETAVKARSIPEPISPGVFSRNHQIFATGLFALKSSASPFRSCPRLWGFGAP